jgi:putative toxin-antitoxin system antitoxin component (TIGR02293 family)
MVKPAGTSTAVKRSKRSRRVPGASVGIKTVDFIQVTQQLKTGFPYGSLTRFQKQSGLTLETITKVLQIPRRALAHRNVRGSLTPQESERLLRLALVFEKAVDLFEGNTHAARDWLQAGNKALAGASPLAVVETEIGAREVEDLIGRLEHGVFA